MSSFDISEEPKVTNTITSSTEAGHAHLRLHIPQNNFTNTTTSHRNNRERPTLASPEDDSLDGDREVVHRSYPGVDDSFFPSDSDTDEPPLNPDAENIPLHPNKPPEIIPPDSPPPGGHDNPPFFPRFGGDGEDDNDGPKRRFPLPPGVDIEGGGFDLESIPDVNVYQHKKTLAQGMMDLALLSANANQLRYVLESYGRHPYFYPSLVMISLSLLLQVAVGVGLIWNATYNIKDDKEICKANRVNNLTISGIFLVTVINVFISAFGVATPAVEVVEVQQVQQTT